MSFLKDITIENVISFVVKAMANDLKVWVVGLDQDTIEIVDDESKKFCRIWFCNSSYILGFRTMKGEFEVQMDQPAYNKFKVLCDSIKQYTREKGVEEFNNFFKEDNKPTDINDLDEED